MRVAVNLVSGTNAGQTRAFNRRVVLETIRVHGTLSRAEIARLTHLTPQTVASIAKDLSQAGFLHIGGRRKSKRGQPPVDISINPKGGYTIGVQLDRKRLCAVLTDLAGNVCGRRDTALDRATPEEVLPSICDRVAELVRRSKIPRRRILGVGLVMPGPFDVAERTVSGPAALPGWQQVGVADELSLKIGFPVTMENDATAAALGEYLYGAARNLRHFFYVFLGTGLGAGIIIDGQPYKGAWGNAGEFDHMIVQPDGAPCYCGNAGCLERYVSLQAAYDTLAASGRKVDSADDLALLCRSRDPVLLKWLDEAAGYLRMALNTIENLFDPETILFGGYLPDLLIDEFMTRLEPLYPSISVRRDRTQPRLLKATAGSGATTLGAAALPLFHTLNPNLRLLVKGSGQLAGAGL
jgi:predicted NBD/HSP70 family sugar kinase